MRKLEFNEETHTYTVDGRVLPSVTEICSVADCGELAAMNPAVLAQAQLRGTLVHEYCEAIDNGYDPEELDIEPELVGYVRAYLSFLRDYNPHWELIEYMGYSEVFGYAGTLDRAGIIGGKKYIVDIKTTASPTRITKIKWAMQLSAYSEMVYRIFLAEKMIDVKLGKDGNYTIYDHDETCKNFSFNVFSLFSMCLLIYKKMKGLDNE